MIEPNSVLLNLVNNSGIDFPNRLCDENINSIIKDKYKEVQLTGLRNGTKFRLGVIQPIKITNNLTVINMLCKVAVNNSKKVFEIDNVAFQICLQQLNIPKDVVIFVADIDKEQIDIIDELNLRNRISIVNE